MSSLAFEPRLAVFDGLKFYSRADVKLLNLFADLFLTGAEWSYWIQEGLGDLLEVAGERVVMLEQTCQLEPGEAQKLSFQKDEIGIGRGSDNDIVIPPAGVGRHHARIIKQDKHYILEDLGSANGTFLNDEKIEPHKPAVLTDGAQILIFPYQFTFTRRQIWNAQKPLQLASNVPRIVSWGDFSSHGSGLCRLFGVKVSPDVGSAALRVSQDFLRTLVDRTSRGEITHPVPADAGLFEFLLLSVLERANRELRFPFRFSLIPLEALAAGEQGIFIECVMGASGARGIFEVFIPASLIKAIGQTPCENRTVGIPVSWPVLATVGYCDLNLRELAELEVGDALLIASEHGLLLPAAPRASEHGWRAEPAESDPHRLRIGDYFERGDFTMNRQTEPAEQSDAPKANLAALPVRVHVVLSQLEMSLADLNKLQPGSVVELDREKSDCVQLAVNGRIAGAGELVEIEGRLGVRISNWDTQ